MKKNRTAQYGLYLLLGMLPPLLFLLYCGLMTGLGHPVRLVPSVRDEMFWYHQISAIVKSGRPLGYFGYDGGRAPVGTFGPWGVAILLPHALFGKIFGWTFASMSIANILFLGLALASFGFLCRLTPRETAFAAAGYVTLLLNVRFSVSNMAEALRWSMAILLLGCVIRIYRGYAGKVFTFVTVPLLLFFTVEAYLLLAIFIPVYFMEVLPVKSFWKRGISSAAVSVPVVLILRKLLVMTESGYKSIGTEESFLHAVWDNSKVVLRRFTPGWIFSQRKADAGFISLYFAAWVLLFLLTAFLLAGAYVRFRREKIVDRGAETDAWYRSVPLMRAFLCVYLMGGTIAGFCVVYANPSSWTMIRGLHTAAICCVLLLCLAGKKRFIAACAVVCLISLPSFIRSGAVSMDTRYQSDENMELIVNARTDMEQVFDISKEHTAWENTIAQYGDRKSGVQTALTLAMPENAGYNVMLDSWMVSDAKYAVVYRSFREKGQYRAVRKHLEDHGYHVVWKHKALTVLSR